MEVRGVLFDFGHTLFAHAELSVTIAECARRLEAPISGQLAAAMARRIDEAAMAPEELAHPRDLDPEVWKQRWEVLYGMADEWVDGLGAAIDADMHDPEAWVPYLRSATTLRSLTAHGLAVGIISNTGWDVRAVFAAHSMIDAGDVVHALVRGRGREARSANLRSGLRVVGSCRG